MKKTEFREIYDQYHSLVTKIAYDVIEDFQLAQDITQDVFVSLYLNRNSIDMQRVKGWLITCTTRKAIDYRRKTYYEWEVVGKEDITYLGSDTISAECEVLKREILSQILAELYQKNRQWFYIIMKIDIEGEKPEAVANEMGITLNNLRVRHHRAKKWLSHRYTEK
ncbi:RNA polymerase sigma factor [Novisyntrophococcus fermenticellae]|uniref:RNA polymerase sigma factor n=1 Tax=Novisyntrophococcus fermenticellae TaxID=2068655 RepID=UPI001E2E8B01|nr:sigma-70 family RNA polymerase sigma factor [Novisyntrophococcus fermenticellae]